jgi:hypothetical protein
MGFLMLIFVISTPDSIDKHTFYLNQKKNFFSWYLWGTPGPKKIFSSFFRINPQIMIRTHVQLHSNKKFRISLGARKWPSPRSSFGSYLEEMISLKYKYKESIIGKINYFLSIKHTYFNFDFSKLKFKSVLL